MALLLHLIYQIQLNMETIKKLALVVLVTISFASCIVVREPRRGHYHGYHGHHGHHYGHWR